MSQPLAKEVQSSAGHGPESLQLAGLVSSRFKVGMRPLAIGTGLCVALSAPLADFLFERHDLVRRGQTQASELADRLARVAPPQTPGAESQWRRAADRVLADARFEEIAKVEAVVEDGDRLLQWQPTPAPAAWPWVWSEAPLALAGRAPGRLRVAVYEREWLHRDLALLSIFGVLGLTLALALFFFPLKLFREEDLVRLFAWRSIRAAEEERLRVSRDLHDGLGQLLGAASVAWARGVAARGLSPGTEDTEREIGRLIDEALDELRRVVGGLRPPALDDLGLGPAIEALARAVEVTGLSTRVEIEALPRLDSEVEQACFRLAQEALTNVMRHSWARSVRVSLARVGATVVLEVQDDGRGLAPSAAIGGGLGFGLIGAKERAASLGGTVSVTNAPGGGTLLRAVLPLREAA